MYKIIPAAYVFTHVYLNTMQQGIQSLHCAVEFFVQNDGEDLENTFEWATNHKTVRILSARGGEDFDNAMLEANRMASKFNLPYAEFQEPDINGMTTAFGFIVTPEMAFEVETAQESALAAWQCAAMPEGHELAQFLSEFPSAR